MSRTRRHQPNFRRLDTPASAAEAELHIHSIRSEYIGDGRKKLTGVTQRTLEILAKQLYDTSTHFVLELLQNADDNSYHNVSPTLRLAYKPGVLRVDCNEIGFSRSNVQAICSTNESTKDDRDVEDGFTGEKGIGFKSVFRMADVVWIASHHYQFKLDNRETLGMIAPTWDPFPEPLRRGWTSFRFQLRQNDGDDIVLQALQGFRPEFLMFLRRIKSVQIEVTQEDGTTWSRTIRKSESKQNGVSCVTLNTNGNESRYLLNRHTVDAMPSEDRRSGQTTSIMSLAFELRGTSSPPSQSQKVYAGLPVGDYGLKFLINGDFLLAANRQQIDITTKWNAALRDGVAQAFLSTVDIFNNGDSKYVWPYYVSPAGVSDFFKPVIALIVQGIHQRNVLESMAGPMLEPKRLTWVDPAKFADKNGAPFTSSEYRYLSSKYPLWAVSSILNLGVREMSDVSFLADLNHMVENSSSIFRDKPAEWHSQLASSLLRLADNSALLPQLQTMNMIPLAYGTWTSASAHPLFPPSNLELLGLSSPVEAPLNSTSTNAHSVPVDEWKAAPHSKAKQAKSVQRPSPSPQTKTYTPRSGMKFISIIHPEIVSDQPRKALFERLGVKSMDTHAICTVICALHRSDIFAPAQWSLSELVDHAEYLCNSSWRPTEGVDLWFASGDDGHCKGSELYDLSHVKPDSALGRISRKLSAYFPKLHSAYVDRRPHDKKWAEYLMKSLQISHTPRLVAAVDGATKPAQSARLSEVFKAMFDRCEMSDVIQILNENWRSYAPYLEPTGSQSAAPIDAHTSGQDHSEQDQYVPSQKNSRSTSSNKQGSTSTTVLDEVKRLTVKTRTGSSRLEHTALAMIDTLIDRDNLWPTLDLKIPIDFTLKHRLRCLGVTVESSLEYYIACLRTLKTQAGPVHETVAYIYERLQAYFDADERPVELALNQNALVYVSSQPATKRPSAAQHRWLTLSECIKLQVDVAAQYKNSERLWKSLVATGGVSLASILSQTLSITTQSRLAEIVTILRKLNETLSRSNAKKASNAIKVLSDKAILPVITHSETLAYDSLRAPNDPHWFIGDKPHLVDSFKGKVPLLAISQQDDVEVLKQLLKHLKLGDKTLSSVVKTKTVPRGLERNRTKETFFGARSRFVQALVPKPEPERRAIVRQLLDIRFYVATEIAEIHTVDFGGKSITGHPGIGSSFLDANDDELNLYIARDLSNPLEVVARLARYYEINEAVRLNLLYTLFSVEDTGILETIFAKEGFVISRVDAEAVRHYRTKHAASASTAQKRATHRGRGSNLSGDVDIIPSPFQGEFEGNFKFSSPFQNSRQWTSPTRSNEALETDLENSKHSENRKSSGPASGKKDRRLPHRGVIDEDGDKNNAIDQRLRMQFIGERILSRVFRKNVGELYQPDLHWTSALRTRAGYAEYVPEYGGQASPFTLSGKGVSNAVMDFLENSAALQVAQWRTSTPTYHFELALSVGSGVETFEWTTSQLDRIRQRRLPSGSAQYVSDVMVLVRISGIYSHPEIKFFINPYDLLSSGALTLQPGDIIHAAMPSGVELDKLAEAFTNERQAPVSTPYSPAGSFYNPASPNGSFSPRSFLGSPRYPLYPTPPPFEASQAYIEQMRARWAPQRSRTGLRSWDSFSSQSLRYADFEADSMSSSLRHELGGRLRDQSFASTGWKEQNRQSRGPLRNEDATVYQYSPLGPEDIRLLILYPANYKDALHGIMTTVRFSAAGRYRALSYTWGKDDQRRHPLFTPDGSFSIREPLRDALRALRHRTNTVVLWIDALCINQEDNREKEQQIPVIARVFQGAACTLAHVSNDEQDEEALTTLELIATHSSPKKSHDDFETTAPPCPIEWTSRGVPPIDDPIWPKILQLFARPWFRRSWVVQEVVITTTLTLICRNKTLDWNTLFTAAEAIVQEFEINCKACTALEPFLKLAQMREWDAQNKRWPLRKLLEAFRHTASTVTRDRYYSLLGIASDGHIDLFEPNYSRRFEDVVFCFGLAFLKMEIQEGNPMNILCCAGLGSQASRFQSWIPDWTITRPKPLSHCNDRETGFNASGNLDTNVIHITGTDELAVEVYFVDDVCETSSATNEAEQHPSYFQDIDRMTDALRNKYWQQELDDIRWQVPIAGAVDPTKLVHKKTSVRDSYLAFREYATKVQSELAEGQPSGLSSAESTALWDKGQNYRSLLGDELAGWRFMTTKNRQLCGIGCGSVQKDDAIAILSGGKVPFILRKSDTRSGAYRLVGEAYVEGIMQGEALEFDEVTNATIRIH